MVHLWDRGGTHETAQGGFFGRKNAKKLTFFAKKSAKKKKIKKIKGGFFSSWGFTNKKMKKNFFFFSGPWDHFFGQKMAIFWRKIKFMTKKSVLECFFEKMSESRPPQNWPF